MLPPTPQILTDLDQLPSQPSFLHAEQTQLTQPFSIAEMLQAPHHLAGPPLDSSQELPVCFVLGSPELDAVLQVRPQQGRAEGEDRLPRPAGHALCNAAQDAIGPLGHKGTLLAHGNLSSTRTPRSLSAELPSSTSSPILYCCMPLFLPRCKTLHLLLLNLIRFSFAQLSACPALAEWQHGLQPILPTSYHHKLAEGGRYPLIKVTDEDVESRSVCDKPVAVSFLPSLAMLLLLCVPLFG
ncbi:uncharacterized protein LOC125691181 isoform X2 [Lagopus muta]|uniref:uncharacterized protein LOC125691181 isoform X2 n=1 Tax=Lagopus muta TaxID=64668 RepID=UPI0020A04F08|nr:uncharacterized protein LOC125691181 isoform X2 [Lagopus muta]